MRLGLESGLQGRGCTERAHQEYSLEDHAKSTKEGFGRQEQTLQSISVQRKSTDGSRCRMEDEQQRYLESDISNDNKNSRCIDRHFERWKTCRSNKYAKGERRTKLYPCRFACVQGRGGTSVRVTRTSISTDRGQRGGSLAGKSRCKRDRA